jgi:PiT family inorganic phosphate transporter
VLFSLTLVVSLFFAFWNGFSDAANAISTIVATRVLKPTQAVLLSAIGNFMGVLLGTAVATTIGKGIINPNIITYKLILAALIGGLIFDVATWFWGLPISESHVLIGGLVGAGFTAAKSLKPINLQGILTKVIIPMIISPAISFICAFVLIAIIMRLVLRFSTKTINPYFRYLQLVSSFFFSVTHGSNDGQKVMGILTILLVQQGLLSSFKVPLWVIISVNATIALGTLFGGWKIVKTVAKKITHLRPYQGFSAETGSAIVLAASSFLGFPVSTTHAISGSIMGVGATRSRRAVSWGTARKIILAWLLTIPISAFTAMISYILLDKVI